MPGKSYNLDSLKREYRFPFRVLSVYHCWDLTLSIDRSSNVVMPDDRLEIAIRLRSSSGKVCEDELDGVPCNIGFPHVLIKRPGSCVSPTQLEPRDTLSFQYPSAYLEKLREMDMLPDYDLWEFSMTPAIDSLLSAFQHALYTLYGAGVPDQLDWICFKLLWELSHNRSERSENETVAIKNSSIWLQLHFNEKFNVADVARRYGMSRAGFYLNWSKNFNISPIQYVLELRLQAAAELLQETPYPISRISREVGFCSVDSFHRKFKCKYGMTPAKYREAHRNSGLPARAGNTSN